MLTHHKATGKKNIIKYTFKYADGRLSIKDLLLIQVISENEGFNLKMKTRTSFRVSSSVNDTYKCINSKMAKDGPRN